MNKLGLWQRYGGDDIKQCIIEMEANGFLIDVDFCNTQAERAEKDEQKTLGRLCDWLVEVGSPTSGDGDLQDGVWSSPKQLHELLHDRLGYPPSPIWKKGRVKLKNGERKTDEVALGWVRNRIPALARWGIDELIRLRRIRGCIKYLRKLPTFIAPDGYVHPTCGPAGDADERVGTITGRLAGKNPEFQQIPADEAKDWYHIRKAFIAPPGYTLVVADYSALEVVLMAHILKTLFNDNQLAEMVDPAAPDIHAVNARRVFTQLGWEVNGRPVSAYSIEDFKEVKGCILLRKMIKAISYGIAYGKSVYGFSTSLHDASGNPIGEEKARAVYDAYMDAIPGIPRYHAWTWDFIKKYKGIVGLGGRWCDLRELMEGDEWQQKRAHRVAQNFPLQEGGAAVVGAAGVAIMKDETLRSAGLLAERQVHDEWNWRVPSGVNMPWLQTKIRRHMISSFPLTVPLQVTMGTGANWHDAK